MHSDRSYQSRDAGACVQVTDSVRMYQTEHWAQRLVACEVADRSDLHGCAHRPAYARCPSEYTLCIRSRPSCTASARRQTASCGPRRNYDRGPIASAGLLARPTTEHIYL